MCSQQLVYQNQGCQALFLHGVLDPELPLAAGSWLLSQCPREAAGSASHPTTHSQTQGWGT